MGVMNNSGDNVKPTFKTVPTAAGHQSTYHVYVDNLRVGRVGKNVDNLWVAYTKTNKRLGEPVKTRTAAGGLLLHANGLVAVTEPDTADAVREEAPQDITPTYDVPKNFDEEEVEEEEIEEDEVAVEELIEKERPRRSPGRKEQETPTPTPVPVREPADLSSGAPRPTLWGRIKARFSGA